MDGSNKRSKAKRGTLSFPRTAVAYDPQARVSPFSSLGAIHGIKQPAPRPRRVELLLARRRTRRTRPRHRRHGPPDVRRILDPRASAPPLSHRHDPVSYTHLTLPTIYS